MERAVEAENRFLALREPRRRPRPQSTHKANMASADVVMQPDTASEEAMKAAYGVGVKAAPSMPPSDTSSLSLGELVAIIQETLGPALAGGKSSDMIDPESKAIIEDALG
jgi:hypothetical protein